jgi:hypothetical protein
MSAKSKWLPDVRAIVAALPASFTTKNVYEAGEKKLAAAHPENSHVQAKIRQQLQKLRDLGELTGDGKGTWNKI